MTIFSLKTVGMTHKEARELSEVRRAEEDIRGANTLLKRDAAFNGVPQASIPPLTLLLSVVGPSVALLAKGALQQAGKDRYQKGAAPFVNQLYGPDGEILKDIRRTR